MNSVTCSANLMPTPSQLINHTTQKIKLEDRVTPPFSPIYSLSPHEPQTLREFIDKHLANSLIYPGSLSRAPVLFIKKKDGSLWLCIDFQGLNKITKKDRYLLPWIMDLLESSHKAQFFSKSIYDTLTTSSRFTKAMNGKPLSALAMDLLNGVSCLWDLSMALLLFSASWTTSFQTSWIYAS